MTSDVFLRVIAVQGTLESVDVILKYDHLVEKIIYMEIVYLMKLH